MKEEWLMAGAVVPVDVETTAALVAEIKRLIDVVGGMALAQPEQVDCPRCGHVCSQRPWQGLTEEDFDYLCHLAYTGDEEFALAVQARLKERNK